MGLLKLDIPVAFAMLECMVENKAQKDGRRPRFPTFRGTGLQPGLSLDEGSALRDVMDDVEGLPPANPPDEAPKGS